MAELDIIDIERISNHTAQEITQTFGKIFKLVCTLDIYIGFYRCIW